MLSTYSLRSPFLVVAGALGLFTTTEKPPSQPFVGRRFGGRVLSHRFYQCFVPWPQSPILSFPLSLVSVLLASSLVWVDLALARVNFGFAPWFSVAPTTDGGETHN
uniref:Secreted protein n=1 Tax=Physcomitrium patens TaxID=3218 RepID=A0A2K1IZS9_PHYPA|nr:hypothetical protein PHYPA_022692 [Physcomitrium patens]